MRLKTKLRDLINTSTNVIKPKQDFSATQEIRQEIKKWMDIPLAEFCRRKPSFDMRHGLVIKLLKTDSQRLKNGVLTVHDMNYWLRQNKPTPALWIIRLAGRNGQVARNTYVKWANENLGTHQAKSVYNWTKKWGIPGDSYSDIATIAPSTVEEARKIYAQRTTKGKARQILGNTLLKQVAYKGEPEEVYAFYKSLNKDVVTFQIMFAAMVKNKQLGVFWDQVWTTLERQEASNNLKMDKKLIETAQIAKNYRADQ